MKTYLDINEPFETTIIDNEPKECKVKCSLDGTILNDRDENGHNYDFVSYLEIKDIFVTYENEIQYYPDFETMKKSNFFDKYDLKSFEKECEERMLEDHSLMREERLSK